MAEAGIDGAKLKAEKSSEKATLTTNLEKIWFLAAAPSSLSRATRQWSLLSTATSGVNSWVHRVETISNKIKRLSESLGSKVKIVEYNFRSIIIFVLKCHLQYTFILDFFRPLLKVL